MAELQARMKAYPLLFSAVVTRAPLRPRARRSQSPPAAARKVQGDAVQRRSCVTRQWPCYRNSN